MMIWTMIATLMVIYFMVRRIERLEDGMRELRAKGAFDSINDSLAVNSGYVVTLTKPKRMRGEMRETNADEERPLVGRKSEEA